MLNCFLRKTKRRLVQDMIDEEIKEGAEPQPDFSATVHKLDPTFCMEASSGGRRLKCVNIIKPTTIFTILFGNSQMDQWSILVVVHVGGSLTNP